MPKAILIAAMDFSNVPADEFNVGTIPSTFPSGSGCRDF